jgi:hypothetical protein
MRAGPAFVCACLFLSSLSLAALCSADERRVIVAIGSNHGLDAERPLTFAERDAERFAKVMTELGGATGDDVSLVTAPTPRRVMQALVSAGARLGKDSMLVVYYSGHGSDVALHMQGERLDLAQLRAAVDSLPARLRLLVVDACRDSAAEKGFSPVEPFAISLTLAAQHRGVVTMQSAGPGEVALESMRLRSGLFSHYLISGLRGAADRDSDGRISVNEAYDFAYSRTLQQSASAIGRTQHPTIHMDIEGAGPLVLTSVAPTKSLLVLPSGRDVHYVVFEKGSQTAFAEAWSEPDHPTRVALPAGHFIVQRRSGDASAVGEVTLPFGGTRSVAPTDFRPIDDEELTLRGGDQVLRAQRVAAAFGVTLQQGNLGEGLALGYQHGSNQWQLALALGASRYQYDRDDNHVQRDALSVLAGLQYTELFSQVSWRIGAGAAATLHRQELLTPLLRDRDQALGFGPYARMGVSVPLMPWLDFELALVGLATFFKEDAGPTAAGDQRVAVDASALVTSGLGVAF